MPDIETPREDSMSLKKLAAAARTEAGGSPEHRSVTDLSHRANRLAELGNFEALTSEDFRGIPPNFLARMRATAYRVVLREHNENGRFFESDDPEEVARVLELGETYKRGLTKSMLEAASGVEVTDEQIANAQKIMQNARSTGQSPAYDENRGYL